jgi:hypothetical protein
VDTWLFDFHFLDSCPLMTCRKVILTINCTEDNQSVGKNQDRLPGKSTLLRARLKITWAFAGEDSVIIIEP